MDIDLENNWQKVVKRLSEQFGGELDIEGILFLIGVQELGKGVRKFTKDQKLEVLHIAICTLLAPFGYYEFKGLDEEGWPHWQLNEKLPPLKPLQQDNLIREAIVDYFKEEISE